MKSITLDLQSHFINRKIDPGEPGDRPVKTEQLGWMTNKKRIEQMFVAGERLREARQNEFDFASGEIDFEKQIDDVTRETGFDRMDVIVQYRQVMKALRDQKKQKMKEFRDKMSEEAKEKLKAALKEEMLKNPPEVPDPPEEPNE